MSFLQKVWVYDLHYLHFFELDLHKIQFLIAFIKQ